MGTQDDIVEIGKTNRLVVDVFTHSSTGFPGAWTEDEIQTLLDAWEEAVKGPRPLSKGFNISERVLDMLNNKNFRAVKKGEVWKQMSTLRTEYKTYLGLVKIGIPTVKGNCVPQMERILRKSGRRRARRRRTSTASNQIGSVSEDDGGVQDGVQLQIENSEDENATRSRRVRFQRQNLQRTIRTMFAQQRTIMENLQVVFKKIDESNDKIISLLGELVARQKVPDMAEVAES